METKIYPDYYTFVERKDKSLNGVTAKFADENPGWDEDCGNRGCWNCSGCSNCSNCYGCDDCSGCFGCDDCHGCHGCHDCSNCDDCHGCHDCSNCSGCFGCDDCHDCSGCHGANGMVPIPTIPNIHRAVLDAASGDKALDMGHWHTCDTTHCRAGWVTHLAGEAGKALERRTSTLFAAMQIYKASSPIRVSPTRFFETNKEAMDDMRRCAEEEAALAEAK